jgi:hypothetical protein
MGSDHHRGLIIRLLSIILFYYVRSLLEKYWLSDKLPGRLRRVESCSRKLGPDLSV